MIRSFCSKETHKIFQREFSKKLPTDIQRIAYRKLRMLHNAKSLNDLRVFPGNRLEALTADRSGQFSIRINKQWRICFVWAENHAQDVEIIDYHN